MKALQNHTLIYDNQCPMCNIYSKGFIGCGMMDEDGRKAFSELQENDIHHLDFHHAQNEIALVNTRNNEVIYGVDSLLVIIGNSFPLLEKIGRTHPIYWLSKKLYKFVSYNRKQIAPSKIEKGFQACVPDFNLKYRLLYIAFVMLFSGWILTKYSKHLVGFLPSESTFGREFIICIGQILWQTIFLGTYLKTKIWDYLGNMMTVSLIGTLLLIPALWISASPLFHTIYFLVVVTIMLLEHYRRCKTLNLNLVPSISWIAYRITVLFFIFN